MKKLIVMMLCVPMIAFAQTQKSPFETGGYGPLFGNIQPNPGKAEVNRALVDALIAQRQAQEMQSAIDLENLRRVDPRAADAAIVGSALRGALRNAEVQRYQSELQSEAARRYYFGGP